MKDMKNNAVFAAMLLLICSLPLYAQAPAEWNGTIPDGYALYVDYPWVSQYYYQQESLNGQVSETVHKGMVVSKTNCTENPKNLGTSTASLTITVSAGGALTTEIAAQIGLQSGSVSFGSSVSQNWSLGTSITLSDTVNWGVVDESTKVWVTPYYYSRSVSGAKYRYNNSMSGYFYNTSTGLWSTDSCVVTDIYDKERVSFSYPEEAGIEFGDATPCGAIPTFSQKNRTVTPGNIPQPIAYIADRNWSYYMWPLPPWLVTE